MSVRLENVSFTYPGTPVGVEDVSLTIDPGEFVAVIGPSGCGKTTVLKLIAGFLSPDRGRILLGGQDATTLPTRRRELGIVFQNYALFPHMSVAENVAYPLKLRGVSADERRRRALAAVETVGLAAFAGRRPPQLSGGQQQRVALARALVFAPKALLLDEPLSALDAARRVEMRDEIRRLQQAHGIATLHITHDQEEALSMADKVVVMAQGRILQAGTPSEIYERPVNRTVAAFVGQANLWTGRVRDARQVETPIGRLSADLSGYRPGDEVCVLVRPERVAPGPAPDGINQFSGTIARDRFLGSMRRFDLSVGGGTVTVETKETSRIDTIHIAETSIQILPLDAEQNASETRKS